MRSGEACICKGFTIIGGTRLISQKSARNHDAIIIYGRDINYTRNVLLAEDKKKYNAQTKGILDKICVCTNHTWFWGGQMVLGRSFKN